MENPVPLTLLTFLDKMRRLQSITYSTLVEERRRGNGIVSHYLRLSLDNGLIQIFSERRIKGRNPSRVYTLTEQGAQLLTIFQGFYAQEVI